MEFGWPIKGAGTGGNIDPIGSVIVGMIIFKVPEIIFLFLYVENQPIYFLRRSAFSKNTINWFFLTFESRCRWNNVR